MRRPFLLLTAGLAAAPWAARAEGKPGPSAPVRVVVQVSDGDPARWTLALNNVRNLQEALGADKVTVEIVAYGPGIDMLRFDAPVNGQVSEAARAGVLIQACENTMRGRKLVAADMHPRATYVPAGVVQIVLRQQEGWAYLRP